MGYSRFSDSDWSSYRTTKGVTDSSTTTSLFSSRRLKDSLDPSKIKNNIRESVDSDANPNSTPVMVFLDVTGSMGSMAGNIAKEGLHTLAKEIYDKKPIQDPHILIGAIGDVISGDNAPLQVTQFEAGYTQLGEQMLEMYIEGGGGANNNESYSLAWYFAANHTSTDSFKNRGKKGFLFTIGDEYPTSNLSKSHIEKVFGTSMQKDSYTSQELYDMASRTYNVYHLIIEEGSFARGKVDTVLNKWRDIMGQNAILVKDYKKIPEIITGILQVNAGINKDEILTAWSGDTSLVVKEAIKGLQVNNTNNELVLF